MVTRKMDFSYKDVEDFVFSDPETYETVTLSAELVGDAKNYLVENATVTVTFVDEKAVSIELPSSVVLTVADAPEGKPASRSRPRSSSRPARSSRLILARASTWNGRKAKAERPQNLYRNLYHGLCRKAAIKVFLWLPLTGKSWPIPGCAARPARRARCAV
jgi:elongation factor P